MPHTHRTFSPIPGALALAAAALALATQARADVRYTTRMQFGGADAAPADATPAAATLPGLRTTTYVKDNHQRVETDMDMGPLQMHQVELTLCDKHQTIRMDPALKIYTAAPIGVATFGPPRRPAGGAMPTGEAMPGDKPGVGHVTMTFNISDLGTEKVAQLDARHYRIALRTQTTGCLGASDQAMQLEEWIAPVKAGLNCPERYSATRTVSNANGCRITYDMKGDWDKMRDLHGGMVVRQKIYSGDKVIATQDLRDYSQAALDDSLFAPPADFKQVFQAEFDKAEQDAMKDRLMGGFGAAAAAAAAGAAAAAKDTATDSASSAANAPGDAANSAAGSAADAASTAAADAAAAAAAAKHKIKIPHFPF